MEVPMPGFEYSLEMWKYLNFMKLCSKLVPVQQYQVSCLKVRLRTLPHREPT